MPRAPRGEKRPADVIGNAVHVMRIATGEVEDGPDEPKPGKDAAAASLGKRGGAARAKALTAEQRVDIASKGEGEAHPVR